MTFLAHLAEEKSCGAAGATRAGRLSHFRRTGDPATADFGDAKVIRRSGEVPDDLSAL
jgi:hypothetical protein